MTKNTTARTGRRPGGPLKSLALWILAGLAGVAALFSLSLALFEILQEPPDAYGPASSRDSSAAPPLKSSYTEKSRSWPDGDAYEGGYLDGRKFGYGVYTWADGRRYKGQWLADQRSGYGTMTWPGGARYEGQWLNGRRSGQGAQIWAEGLHYEGQWQDGRRSGLGTMTWPGGRRYEGQWLEGRPAGYGLMTWPDGRSEEINRPGRYDGGGWTER